LVDNSVAARLRCAPVPNPPAWSPSCRSPSPACPRPATPWVHAVRARQPAPFWAMESLLREYPISSAEGLALMRLAEALLRVPDAETAIALTADQLGRADFSAAPPKARTACWPACRPAPSPGQALLPDSVQPARADAPPGRQDRGGATVRAIQLLGRQFVLGRSIQEALGEADAQRRVPRPAALLVRHAGRRCAHRK
jgi:RHH-type proline utilization regulon transcriptional repressor/proline dehydrogenase/delta 1-pyrroline-5-carboxylate dehydrogenase